MSDVERQVSSFRDEVGRLRAEIARVIVGHEEVVEGTLMSLLAGGHVLIEGVPGLGKTLLVRTLADALDLPFSRVQFTPDLMPADILGTQVLVEDPAGGRRFEFQRGPIFASLVLADEVNRATPKTQSALLEAMQERSVTIAKTTHMLPAPFFVLATQNPLEMEGTYPLPEAQLDRFFVKLRVRLPSNESLHQILDRTTGEATPRAEKVLSGARLLELSQLARQVPVARPVQDFVVRLVQATHPGDGAPELVRKYVRYGSSPRGAQACLLGAKVLALLDGRFAVSTDDLRKVAPLALRHRMILNFEGAAEGIDPDRIIAAILSELPRAEPPR
ncbi:MAG: MoxR family ATPase [Polyangia bacterium]